MARNLDPIAKFVHFIGITKIGARHLTIVPNLEGKLVSSQKPLLLSPGSGHKHILDYQLAREARDSLFFVILYKLLKHCQFVIYINWTNFVVSWCFLLLSVPFTGLDKHASLPRSLYITSL